MDLKTTTEKRPIENGESEKAQLSKKPRLGPDSENDLRRVAEIVVALSAMARVRGGKKPTEAEIGLMEEARSKLVELCEGLPPKDIVGRDAIAAVVEDLGLNAKIKEQRLGFRGPKLTIADKFSLTKRKMEESKKYAAQNAANSSPPSKPSFNPGGETQGVSHTICIPRDKPSYAPILTGGFAASPLVHVSTATPTSAQYQLPTSEVRSPMVSGSVPGSHLGRDSSPAMPRVQLKTDGGSNVSYPFQVQGSWSAQTQSVADQKVSNHKSMMTPLAPRDQSSRPTASQSSSGNLPAGQQPSQKIRFVQASSLPNNHNEIAKIIQKILQPQLPDHPTWIPPSRDYMSKALTCQVCQVSINEVDNVLICDACEKGYHVTCAPPNQRGVPKGEWHCARCLSLSHGKPLPPKYGRVMRSNIQIKVPSSTAGTQMPSENKVGASNPKINSLVGSVSQNPTSGVGTNHIKPASNARDVQGNVFPSGSVNTEEKPVSGNFLPTETSSQQIAGLSTSDKGSFQSGAQHSSDLVKNGTDPNISTASEMQENNLPSSSKSMDEKTLSSERSSRKIDDFESSRHLESSAEPPGDTSNKNAASNVPVASEMQVNNLPSSSKSMDEEPLSGSKLPSERSSQEIDNSESSRHFESRAEPPADLSNKDAASENSNAREMLVNSFSTSSKKPLSGSLLSGERPSKQIDNSEASISDMLPCKSIEAPTADISYKDTDKSVHAQPMSNSEVVDQACPSKDHENNIISKDSDNCHPGEDSDCSIINNLTKADRGIAQKFTCESLVVSGDALENTGFSSDGLRPVEWIGDSIQVVSEQTFYQACCIDGVTYKLQEYALFQSSNGKLIPSKLQSMWEDRNTGSKWIVVRSCCFPSDLPENVGPLSTPESNEVYESNHESTVMAGLIQGPCEVLPFAKFSEEVERRSRIGDEELHPIFLCKWNYDKCKGLLQPLS